MKLICLGSSSSGNGYLLQAADGTLMIECGTPMLDTKRALGFRLSQIVGCLVSHEHGDHAGHLDAALQCGIRVFALPEVFAARPGKWRTPALCREIQPMRGIKVGGFKVLPLPVAHDVPCVGFMIEHLEMGRLLFVTDTMMLRHRIPGLNHLMLECNYSDAILRENLRNGSVPKSQAERVLESHMELGTAKEIIKANDMSQMQQIILIHLSDRNADPALFASEIEKASGRPVAIACKGMTIDLSKEPY